VFHAAFALLLVEGRPMDEIIRFASAAAAIKCTRFGGRLGAPDRAEVEAFLARS
jgi:sulfofructose kinase